MLVLKYTNLFKQNCQKTIFLNVIKNNPLIMNIEFSFVLSNYIDENTGTSMNFHNF